MSNSYEDGKDWWGNRRDDLGVISNKWNETADVVIIGSGFAGLTAAIEAKNGGASVIILEKMKGGFSDEIIYLCFAPPCKKADPGCVKYLIYLHKYSIHPSAQYYLHRIRRM